MSAQPSEAEKVQRAVSGMPAPQALRFLAELVRPGGSKARGHAIAALMDAIADTLDTAQQVVRNGVPIDNLTEDSVELREYAVRGARFDGATSFVTYGDRLFSATWDAARMPAAAVLHRDITVGPWKADAPFTDEGVARFAEDSPA